MVVNSTEKLEQDIRRIQLEGGAGLRGDRGRDGVRDLQTQIDEINEVLNTQVPDVPPVRQGIDNMIRNGDHNHSVNTWWETAPSSNDKEKEAANVYAYAPFAPVTITDAVMSSTVNPNDILSASNPFTAGMTGTYAIIEGAGLAGADLTGILTYVSAGVATLSNPCLTDVTGVDARLNLQKLAHRNKKNSAGSNPNDALKDASHTQIATNISDPDWQRTNGIVRIGSTNIVGYTFGKFDNTGATYAALHHLFAGRVPFCRLNVARANQYVKVTGKLYLGIYNNNESVLDWVKGTPFTVSSSFDPPTPSSTSASTKYMVVIETSQGFTLVSAESEVINGPDDTAIAQGARVSLAWSSYAGSVRTSVYRKRGAGNVFLMEQFENGANTWTDVNLSTRVDTGSATFPVYADAADNIAAYWASADEEFDGLTVDGAPGEFWKPIEVKLPFPPTVNMGEVFDPHFIVGLTEPLATELTDIVTDGTEIITNAAGLFDAAWIGKNATLTKSDGTETLDTTIVDVLTDNDVELGNIVPWTDSATTIVIEDSQPNGLYYDLVGVSLVEGEWANHPEDNSELRGQAVASNPNGSSQGGIGGGDPDDGGGGGVIGCVLDEVVVPVRGCRRTGMWEDLRSWWRNLRGKPNLGRWHVIEKRADEVLLIDRLWNGIGFTDDDFNELDWIEAHDVIEIRWLIAGTKKLPCTKYHRTVAGPETFKCGVAVGNLARGKNVLISDVESSRLMPVSGIPRETGKFRVISFGLKKSKKSTGHLFVANDIVSHNQKIVILD